MNLKVLVTFTLGHQKDIDKRLAVADAIHARHAKERNDYINKNKAGIRQKALAWRTEADAIINISTLDSTEGGKLAR